MIFLYYCAHIKGTVERDSLSVNCANFLFSVENGPVKFCWPGSLSGSPLTGRPFSALGSFARPAGRARRRGAACPPRRRLGAAAADLGTPPPPADAFLLYNRSVLSWVVMEWLLALVCTFFAG